MTSTRSTTLLTLSVLGLALGVLLGERVPPTPVAAPVTLVLVALVLLGLAKAVRDRVWRPGRRPRPAVRPMSPEQLVRAVVLAKASSPTGALLAGGYLGVFLALVPSQAEVLRRDAYVAGSAALAALLVVAAALVLERQCRTPDERDGDRDARG